MPAKSKAQLRFMYAMLEQEKKTGHNKTGMSESQLEEYTHKGKKHLPEHVKKKSGRSKLIGD